MIDTHDPFNRLGRKPAPKPDQSEDPEQLTLGGEVRPASNQPREKRKYIRRTPAETDPQKPVAKPEPQEPELVAALFSTGELTIYVGDEVMHLTSRQRETLESFLGVMASRPEPSRPRRKCVVCQQRRDVEKFNGDSTTCKDCE